MEVETIEKSPPSDCAWNLHKLLRAQKMLTIGFSAQQIGSRLRLSQAQIQELEYDVQNALPAKPATETHIEWRSRKSQEIEKQLVDIVGNHLKGVQNVCVDIVDPDTMGTIKDASQIAHKWLKEGQEGVKTFTLDFGALAQVIVAPVAITDEPPTLEMEEVHEPLEEEAEIEAKKKPEPDDDWLG